MCSPFQVRILFAVIDILHSNNIYSTKLLGILRILLGLERNLLALFKSLKAFALNSGEMYEYILAALIVANETITLLSVEPLNCTSHEPVPPS